MCMYIDLVWYVCGCVCGCVLYSTTTCAKLSCLLTLLAETRSEACTNHEYVNICVYVYNSWPRVSVIFQYIDICTGHVRVCVCVCVSVCVCVCICACV